MATLIFNSNHQHIILPPEALSVISRRVGEIYSLQCQYASWPVNDLVQEWGIDDYPGTSAIRVASFLASPSLKKQDDIKDVRTSGENVYWSTLYPTTPPLDTIDVLIIADADDFFFGVVTSEEEFGQIFMDSDQYDKGAWLSVKIDNITSITLDEAGDEEEIVADLLITGKALAGWIISEVKQISN